MTIESHEQVLLAAMREISEGVLVWSVPGGTVLIRNEAAGRILGASPAEVEGQNLDYPWPLADEDGTP
ncbi:MAG TPA: PAS domain-containing protein [Polyangiaceae bacterium]|nr:PAS domain-containing protein [Polyangiaceae bacterium]